MAFSHAPSALLLSRCADHGEPGACAEARCHHPCRVPRRYAIGWIVVRELPLAHVPCIVQHQFQACCGVIARHSEPLLSPDLPPVLRLAAAGAVTCDAHHMTDPHPDGLGVSTCIDLALKDSGIERDEVNYINAHATSTLVGDKAEVKAIRKVRIVEIGAGEGWTRCGMHALSVVQHAQCL